MKQKITTLLLSFIATAATVFAETETVNGIVWTYEVSGTSATITGVQQSNGSDVSGDITIPSELGGYSVKEIYHLFGVFRNCTSIRTIVFPDTLERIGDHSFEGCTGIKTIYFGSSLKEIGVYAFWGCSGLKKVTLPESMEKLDYGAFHSCAGMQEISIPENVSVIGNQSFMGCSSLSSITIPSKVATINEGTFHDCTSLTNVTISTGVLSIATGNSGYGAFSGCTSLKSLIIPDSVITIEREAFKGCSSLESIVIGRDVGFIGAEAFGGNLIDGYCNRLSCIIFRGDAPVLGSSVFYNVAEDCCAYVSKSSTGWGASIPGTWNGIRIAYMDEEPEVVTYTISYDANGGVLVGNSSASVESGKTLVSMPTASCSGYTFEGWYTSATGGTKITTMTSITSSMTLYAHWTEESPVQTWTVTFHANGGVYLGSSRTYDIIDGESLGTMPNAKKDGYDFVGWFTSSSSGVQVFSNTPITSSMTLHAHWVLSTDVGQDVAWTYRVLNNEAIITGGSPITGDVRFPTSVDGYQVTSIDQYAFTNNHNVTSVIIPEGIRSIGSRSFYGCNNLTSVTIPDSVTSIGLLAFYGCSSLADGDGFVIIRNVLYDYCGVGGNVIIPESVTGIGASAFFRNSDLVSVTIGKGVTNIGGWAFNDCNGLTSVTMRGDCPTVGPYAFNNIGPSCVVWLPKGNETYTVIDGKWQGMTVEYYNARFVVDEGGVLTSVVSDGATEIVVPNYVTGISANAFSGCSALENVTIPDSVESIAPTAFDGCGKLWAKWFRTLERLSDGDAVAPAGVAGTSEVALTVTNVVVHYVTTAAVSEAVTPSEDVGIVNVISEVSAGTAVAISSEWAAQYPGFSAKFGSDFTKAITKPTGKRDGAGNAMMVWQDFVAGTDPTDESDVFTASITFDKDTNEPVISWTPELTPAEAAKRKYTTYGKAKLTDKNWTEVALGEENGYNFFKVTVEMR